MQHNDQKTSELNDVRNLIAGVTPTNAEFSRDTTLPSSQDVSIVPRSPTAPNAPVVAGGLAAGPQLTFLEFLSDEDCRHHCIEMFGLEASSAATMLAEFRLGSVFDYFGPVQARPNRNAGKLDRLNSETKKLLKAFAHRAYRGDREKRGVMYWARIATMIWHAYAHLMAMREQNERITGQENERRAKMKERQAAATERKRQWRARQLARSQRPSVASPVSDDSVGHPPEQKDHPS